MRSTKILVSGFASIVAAAVVMQAGCATTTNVDIIDVDSGSNSNSSSPSNGTDSGSSKSVSTSSGGIDAGSPSSSPPPSGDMDAGTTSSNDPTDANTPSMPDTSTGTGTMPPPAGFDQFQEHNLEVVNMYRATLNIAPLVLDKTLSTFALAGSTELSMDHTPHQHFITASNNNSIWMDGFNMNAGENQGDPNGWTVLATDPTTNELDQIDQIQKQMFDEGPGAGEAHGHYTNMMDATFTKIGVGLLEVSNSLYLTNDFSD
jgi:uncharacterized protein YkwD